VKPSYFIKKEHNDAFLSKGYFKIDLLNSADIHSLISLFDSYKSEFSDAFHTSHFSSNVDYKSKVHSLISKVVGEKVKLVSNHLIPIFGNFMIKLPGFDFAMPLHPDWTYVDEKQNRSVAIWIPLIDTDEKNGTFGVIEYSHKVTNAIRGPRIKHSSLKYDTDWTENFGKLIACKAGQAIFYDHALLHFSPPNKSDKVRPAINLSLVPKDTAVVHYCLSEDGNSIEKFGVSNPDFFIQYDNFQRPKLGIVKERINPSDIELMDSKFANHYNPKNFLERLYSFFRK